MEIPKKEKWTSVKSNKDFIFVRTHSGWRTHLPDPEGKQFYVSHAASDEELGQSVMKALAASRRIDPRECDPNQWVKSLTDDKGRVLSYIEWVAQTMAQYGYKTKRAMFKDMKSCIIEMADDMITMQPWHHVKLEAWDGDGLTEKDNAVISADSSPAEVGAALRLALSRCRP
jgi:hypothetical protein